MVVRDLTHQCPSTLGGIHLGDGDCHRLDLYATFVVHAHRHDVVGVRTTTPVGVSRGLAHCHQHPGSGHPEADLAPDGSAAAAASTRRSSLAGDSPW